jgi:hypothetical protein
MIFSKGVPLSAKLCFYLLPCRSDALPFDEIKDVYLLDFVVPPGFVNDIAPKVERSAHFYFSTSWLFYFCQFCSCLFNAILLAYPALFSYTNVI